LDLSRIEAGAYRMNVVGVNPSEVLVSCVSRLTHSAESRRQRLTLELPSQLPTVRADHSALRRLLCNLIENAIKYTPDEGTITVGAVAEDDQVVFQVRDSGPGIREQDIPHIFDKFYRAEFKSSNGARPGSEKTGVGLGLYIVHNIVTQLGGRINARNGEGGGAIFAVRLPRWDLPTEKPKNGTEV
jgi:signal transduction histidine kinase